MSDHEQTIPPKLEANQSGVAPSNGGSKVRMPILMLLLIMMLGALWYDRQIVRPKVESAYDRIEALNSRINSRPGKSYMTAKDVQDELQMQPATTESEGGYYIEKYSWRAGLPIKTHDYYAVYADGAPYIFLKQFKFGMDRAELKLLPLKVQPPLNVDPNEVHELQVGRPEGEPGLGGRSRGGRRPMSESAGAAPTTEEAKTSSEGKEPKAKSDAAAKEPASTPSAEPK